MSVYLATRGKQDYFLTERPEFTFFNKVYSRDLTHTSTTETIPFDSGGGTIATLPIHGDYISDITLKVILPPLNPVLPLNSIFVQDVYSSNILPQSKIYFYSNASDTPIKTIRYQEYSNYIVGNKFVFGSPTNSTDYIIFDNITIANFFCFVDNVERLLGGYFKYSYNVTQINGVTSPSFLDECGWVHPIASTLLNNPGQLVANSDGSSIFFIDTGNSTIRKMITKSPYTVTTVISSDISGVSGLTIDNNYLYATTDLAIKQFSLVDYTATTLVSLSGLTGYLTIDSNYIYATTDSSIKTISLVDYTVTTIVNSGLSSPKGLAVDSNYLYVADTGHSSIKIVSLVGYAVTTIVSTGLNSPKGLAIDSNYLYVADAGNSQIKKISLIGYTVTILAGSTLPGFLDGIGTNAFFSIPSGVAIFGNLLYVADTGNSTIRRISISSGITTTLAGTATISGNKDTTATSYPDDTMYYYINSISLVIGKQLIQQIPGQYLKIKKDISNTFKNVPILKVIEGDTNISYGERTYFLETGLLKGLPVHQLANQDIQVIIDSKLVQKSLLVEYVSFGQTKLPNTYTLVVPQVQTFPNGGSLDIRGPITKIISDGSFNFSLNGEQLFDSDSSNVSQLENLLNISAGTFINIFKSPVNMSRIRDKQVTSSSNVWAETLNILKIHNGLSGLLFESSFYSFGAAPNLLAFATGVITQGGGGGGGGAGGLYAFSSFTFTTAGSSGSSGPSLGQIQTYSLTAPGGGDWTQNTNYLNSDGQGKWLWTVPFTGLFNFEVAAASGQGVSYYSYGGRGVVINSSTLLIQGDIIAMLVGQAGNGGAGGGGGTFVYNTTTSTLLFAAGGGAGGGSWGSGGDGVTSNTGGNGQGSNDPFYGSPGQGGSNGNGGSNDSFGPSSIFGQFSSTTDTTGTWNGVTYNLIRSSEPYCGMNPAGSLSSTITAYLDDAGGGYNSSDGLPAGQYGTATENNTVGYSGAWSIINFSSGKLFTDFYMYQNYPDNSNPLKTFVILGAYSQTGPWTLLGNFNTGYTGVPVSPTDNPSYKQYTLTNRANYTYYNFIATSMIPSGNNVNISNYYFKYNSSPGGGGGFIGDGGPALYDTTNTARSFLNGGNGGVGGAFGGGGSQGGNTNGSGPAGGGGGGYSGGGAAGSDTGGDYDFPHGGGGGGSYSINTAIYTFNPTEPVNSQSSLNGFVFVYQ